MAIRRELPQVMQCDRQLPLAKRAVKHAEGKRTFEEAGEERHDVEVHWPSACP